MAEEQLDKIEAFLNGELDFESLSAGLDEAALANLQSEIKATKAARSAVFAAGIREDLTELHAKAKAPAKHRKLTRWYGIAAAVLLTIVASVWLLRENSNNRFADYRYQDPGLPVIMGIAENPDFAEAMTLFKQEKYAEAYAGFSSMRRANNDTLIYYLGASAFYANKTQEASSELGVIATDENSLFKQKAQWLVVLNNLKEGQPSVAKANLKNIINNPNHRFHAQAQELSNELNK